MAASRASSFRALRQLSSTQARKLHMTGPATFPSPMLTTERPAFSLPRDIAGLKAECEKRKLSANGTQAELTERLTADELVRSRSYSTFARREARRPTPKAPSSEPGRHFNTSRALKAVNDSSTMDFAFLPNFDADAEAAQAIRVPLLFSNSSASLAEVEVAQADEIMPRTIVSVTNDASHISSPSSIIESGTIISNIFGSTSSSTSSSASKSQDGEMGMAKQIWTDFLEDLSGLGQKKAKA